MRLKKFSTDICTVSCLLLNSKDNRLKLNKQLVTARKCSTIKNVNHDNIATCEYNMYSSSQLLKEVAPALPYPCVRSYFNSIVIFNRNSLMWNERGPNKDFVSEYYT